MVLVLGLLLILIALALLGSALRTSTPTVGVPRSLEVLAALTGAPKAIQEEVDRPFAERVIGPFQARAVRLGRRLSGADSGERIRRRLDLAGNPRGWSVDAVVAGKVLGAIVGVVAAALFSLMLGSSLPVRIGVILVGTLIGFVAPNLYLYQRTYERSERMQRDLPDALDLLTISVESGLGFDAAVQQVSRKTHGPLADEFSRMLREMQIGQGRAEALRAFSERTNVADVKSFVSAMVQADAFGVPVAQVLRIQTSEIRVKRRQRAEERAQQVPVKMTIPLIFCILPCLFIAVMGPAAISIMDAFQR